MVKLQRKQVVAITQASHAEYLLTIMQIIIHLIFFFQSESDTYGIVIEGSMIRP